MTGEDHRLTKQGDVTGLLDSVMASSELSFAAADLAIKKVQPDQRIDELETSLVHRPAGLPFGGEPHAAIARLASTMNRIGGLELQPVHRFAEGLYARELTIPAGCLIVSHIHRGQHICCCSRGSIIVFQTDGGTRLIEAGETFVSEPGGQRVGYAYEETIWTTYHATTERDLDKLEALLYEKKDFEPYIEGDIERLTGWLELIGRTPLQLTPGGVE